MRPKCPLYKLPYEDIMGKASNQTNKQNKGFNDHIYDIKCLFSFLVLNC